MTIKDDLEELIDERHFGDVLGLLNPKDSNTVCKALLDVIYGDGSMRWRGLWSAGTYEPGDVVRDGGWLMTALVTTEDRAAPEQVGDAEWDQPDAQAFTEQSTADIVFSGHEYTLASPVEVRGVRVWLPEVDPDIDYRVLFAVNPDGPNPRYESTGILPPLQIGWNTVTLGQAAYAAGTKLLVALSAVNSSATSQVTGGWRFDGTSQSSPPAAEGWNTNNQGSVLRIDTDDLDTVDRKTELLGIVAGSTIQFVDTLAPANNITFLVLAPPVDQTDYIEYQVETTDINGSIDVADACTMTADIPVASSTKYVENTAWWSTEVPQWATDVVGKLQFDDVPQGGVDDYSFGVSLLVQELNVSPDWDIMASSETGGGSGAGGEGADLGWTVVTEYGATGDGVTDDTAGIEAAILAAPAGGVVYFPPGTYKVSNAILLAGDRTYLAHGATVERIDAGAPTGTLWPVLVANGITDVRIQGLTVKNITAPDLDASALSDSSDILLADVCIAIVDSDRVTVEECVVENFTRGIAWQDDCHEITVRANLVLANTGESKAAIRDGTKTADASWYTSGTGGIIGMDWKGAALLPVSTDIRIEGNAVFVAGLDSGISIGEQTYDAIRGVVERNLVDGCNGGILRYQGSITDPGTATTINCEVVINDNRIMNAWEQGIYLRGCAGVLCEDNRIDRAGTVGLLKGDGSAGGIVNRIPAASIYTVSTVSFDVGNKILGNMIINPGRKVDGELEFGIRCDGDYTTVEMNTVGREAEWFGANLKKGLGIDNNVGFSGQPTSRIRMMVNQVYGFETGVIIANIAPVVDQGEGQFVIRSNHIYDCAEGLDLDVYTTGVEIIANTFADCDDFGMRVRNSPKVKIEQNTLSNCGTNPFQLGDGCLQSHIDGSTVKMGPTIICNFNAIYRGDRENDNSFVAINTTAEDATLENRLASFEGNLVDGRQNWDGKPFRQFNAIPLTTGDRRPWQIGDEIEATNPGVDVPVRRVCTTPGQNYTLAGVTATGTIGTNTATLNIIDGVVVGCWITVGADTVEVIKLDAGTKIITVSANWTANHAAAAVAYQAPVFEGFDTLMRTFQELRTQGGDVKVGYLQADAAQRLVTIGEGRSVNGDVGFWLVGDTTYTNGGLKMTRQGTPNGSTTFDHMGTGNLAFRALQGGQIQFWSSVSTLNARSINDDFEIYHRLKFRALAGVGVNFWNSDDSYSIQMSAQGDATYGGRLDSTSDFNMYFRMTGGTNRGFVFKNGASTVTFQIDGAGDLWFRTAGATLHNQVIFDTPPELPSYTVAGLPAAGNAGRWAYCTDETGGAVPVFSDGTNWRRCTDRAIAS